MQKQSIHRFSKICLLLVLIGLLGGVSDCALCFASLSAPESNAPESIQAFNELAGLYERKAGPDVPALWQKIHSLDAAIRQHAGQYLLALLRQSFADETGRSTFSNLPPGFIEGPQLLAREFRKQLAAELPEHAAVPEAIPAIEWLLRHDVLASTRVAAATTLRKIHSPAADRLLISLLSPPDADGQVLIDAIEEATLRRLPDAAPLIPPLTIHYRTKVRTAALAAAKAFHLTDLPHFDPQQVLTDHFGPTLNKIAQLVFTPIPANAPFVTCTISPLPDSKFPRTYTTTGWLLEDQPDTLKLLNVLGEEERLPKSRTVMTPSSLKHFAEPIIKLREALARGDQAAARELEDLSTAGGYSGQFEPGQLRLPEVLTAVWAYQRHDTALAAAILLPRIDDLEDEIWLYQIPRDLLGENYYKEMLTQFIDFRDYPAALRYARHLSSPLFDGFYEQYPATQLLTQIPARINIDFISLTLPTPADWRTQRRQLTRARQIQFLCDRLRLINCRQPGWPSDSNLAAPQRSLPFNQNIYTWPDRFRGVQWINPLAELQAMLLEPSDIPLLIPYLTDENYVLSYNAWRPWASNWRLFTVNELIADLINEAAGRRFVSLRDFYAVDPEHRPAYLASLTANSTALSSRPIRALTNFQPLLKSPGDPIAALAAALIGAFLLWHARRKNRPFGPAVALLLLALVALFYPSLQHERTLLWLANTPAFLLSVYAAITLWQNLRAPMPLIAAAVILPIPIAFLFDYFFQIPSYIGMNFLLILLILPLPVILALHRTRKGWPWPAIYFLLLAAIAFVNFYPRHFLRSRGFEVNDYQRQYIDYLHFIPTIILIVAILALARFLALRIPTNPPANLTPLPHPPPV